MISASPHPYRAEGLIQGRSDALIDRAIAQAAPPEAKGLPSILTLRHLAHRTDVDYRYLRSVIASKQGDHYRDFLISKRTGGGRRIGVPEPKLKAVQRWIVDEILASQPTHPASCAYSKGNSIVACAKRHAKAGWLIKLDIHDFFESIRERSVYHVFRGLGYQPLVSFELARLCTKPWITPPRNTLKTRRVRNYWHRGIPVYRREYTGYLPQGAPTSPMLSNLACRRLDEGLAALARDAGLVFTRYSDDLTFSAPAPVMDRARAMVFVGAVRTLLAKHGFRMHERKISIVPPGGRKLVLGLLVDRENPRLTREMRERITDHVRGIERFGITAHAAHRKFEAPTGMVAHIAGLVRFARHVDQDFADPLRLRLESALKAHGWPAL